MTERKKPSYDFYLLIPFYNNLFGLIRSLKSIVYDPAAYGLLIVDDGSEVKLHREDLHSYLPQGLSLTILRLRKNQGITAALNTGLNWLMQKDNCRYVARLDCGDLCMPERFTRQVSFLDGHPAVGMVGSWCIFKDFRTGDAYRYITPTGYGQILRDMHFRNVFIHPTVMWRSDMTKKIGVYPYNFPHAEDYGFFYKIISEVEAAILPVDLVICEINPQGISRRYRNEQLKSRMKVIWQYGNNRSLRILGILKLWIFMIIPYEFILRSKKFIYGIKHNRVN